MTEPKQHHDVTNNADANRGGYFATSVVLHVLAIIALVYLTPLRTLLDPREQIEKDKTERATSQQVHEVSEHLEASMRERMIQDIQRMQEVLDEMHQVAQSHRQQLRDVQQAMVDNAPAEALAAMQRAKDAQQRATQLLDSVPQDPEAIEAHRREIEKAQAHAATEVAEAVDQLSLAGQPFADVAQQEEDAQKAQRDARAAVESARQAAKDRANAESALDKVNRSINDRSKQREKEAGNLEQAQQNLRDNQARIDAARAALDAAKSKLDATSQSDDPVAWKQRQGEVTQATRDLEKALGSHRLLPGKVEESKTKRDRIDQDIKDTQRQASDAERDIKDAQAQHDAQLKQAAQDQARANALQQAAIDTMVQAVKERQPANPTDEQDDPGDHRPTVAELRQMTTPRLYDHARDLEQRIATSVRDVRAVELADRHDVSLPQAMSMIEVSVSPRPSGDELFDPAEPTPPDDPDALERHKTALRTATRQVDDMSYSSEQMKQTALGTQENLQKTLAGGLDDLVRRRREMDRASQEDAGQQAVDLSQLMQPGDGQLPGGGDNPYDPFKISQLGPGGGSPGYPELDIKRMSPPVAGRAVTADGIGADWMYVDGWWVVGPFPNPDRRHIHTAFAPETILDLDASYEGARGQSVRWRYVTTKDPLVVPPNADEYEIWYAYTELYFEQPAELWVAVGSDDRSDIWVNGQKIWTSSDKLKAWRINEGYRKVRFEQGVNRILYRIENGHASMGFSMILHVGSGS